MLERYRTLKSLSQYDNSGQSQIYTNNLLNTQITEEEFVASTLKQARWRLENCLMKIGQVIRKIRKEKGVTLEQVALTAGTDPGNLSKVERNLQQPTPDMLEQVAKALGLPVSSLYLMAEQTVAPHQITGSKEEVKQATQRLEGFVTQFMLLSPANQQLINEFIGVMLKAQPKSD